MKITEYLANDRGYANFEWLEANYSFSFSNYYNPAKMGFGALRVLNDDSISAGTGFGMHPHENMEIITIPLSGTVSHKDDQGNSGTISRGEIQLMSAGSGIYHSEKNASSKEQLKLFQIWIIPQSENTNPKYEQLDYNALHLDGKWANIISPKKEKGKLQINQNAFLSLTQIKQRDKIDYKLNSSKNGLYLMVIEGDVSTEAFELKERDAIGIEDFESISIEAKNDSFLLAIEVPMII
ncbi:pirin family protein [Aureibacter tunicatorum]|uniref:Pirin family protein n=1 Tax=Aureibacter tunicatorum TaxID=866807 RepID=A0AAE4BQP3_9BACT|nr:pirin family protein [Aureibacter tunicatorum]MDR6239364.1 hypothetical protein [Aureibacter tunicatorum]BDD04713.1 hypothetical protein AUTU_21960 [Aureibacter tunicatorum]